MERSKKIKILLIVLLVIAILLMISYYQFKVECDKDTSKLFIITSIVLSVIAIFGVMIIYTRKDIKEEKLFLSIIPFMAIIMMIFMPFGRAHDELRHFTRSYEISKGNILSDVIDGKVESVLPIAITNLYDEVGWRNVKYNDLKERLDKQITEETVNTDMKYTAVYSPVQYLPQAIGICIADIFTNNVFIIAYSARLFNMIFSLLLIYFAIRIIPFGKKIIIILCMIPITLESISSISPDAMTIAVSLLFIAYVLRICKLPNYKINFKDKIILSAMSILIAFCKIVYLPLIGIILLIPKDRYKNIREQITCIMVIWIIAIICSLGWLIIANNFLSISSDGNSGNKIMNILKDPIEYIGNLLYTMNYYGIKYLSTGFGTELAWNENAKTYFIVSFAYFLLFIQEACTSKELKQRFNNFQTIIMTLVIVAVITLIFTSLYIQYTKNNSVIIEGVQGRYFIPIMLIIAMILSKVKIENNYSEQQRTKLIGATGLITQIYVILSIIIVHL